ncbi:MAG: hypothetical protein FJ293_04790 [Planctomycetes bacterium]|nr:hypothetical protein [Planctomycetota bacterium]
MPGLGAIARRRAIRAQQVVAMAVAVLVADAGAGGAEQALARQIVPREQLAVATGSDERPEPARAAADDQVAGAVAVEVAGGRRRSNAADLLSGTLSRAVRRIVAATELPAE